MDPIQTLRDYCKAAEAEQKQLGDLETQIAQHKKHVEGLEAQREQQRGKVAYAIGGRDALAKTLLPDGKTLAAAWDEDWQGLRTGEVDKPRPKVVESDADVEAKE